MYCKAVLISIIFFLFVSAFPSFADAQPAPGQMRYNPGGTGQMMGVDGISEPYEWSRMDWGPSSSSATCNYPGQTGYDTTINQMYYCDNSLAIRRMSSSNPFGSCLSSQEGQVVYASETLLVCDGNNRRILTHALLSSRLMLKCDVSTNVGWEEIGGLYPSGSGYCFNENEAAVSSVEIACGAWPLSTCAYGKYYACDKDQGSGEFIDTGFGCDGPASTTGICDNDYPFGPTYSDGMTVCCRADDRTPNLANNACVNLGSENNYRYQCNGGIWRAQGGTTSSETGNCYSGGAATPGTTVICDNQVPPTRECGEATLRLYQCQDTGTGQWLPGSACSTPDSSSLCDGSSNVRYDDPDNDVCCAEPGPPNSSCDNVDLIQEYECATPNNWDPTFNLCIIPAEAGCTDGTTYSSSSIPKPVLCCEEEPLAYKCTF